MNFLLSGGKQMDTHLVAVSSVSVINSATVYRQTCVACGFYVIIHAIKRIDWSVLPENEAQHSGRFEQFLFVFCHSPFLVGCSRFH